MLKPIDLFFLIGLTVVCTGASIGAIEAGLIQPKSVESYADHAIVSVAEADRGGPTPYPTNERDWPGVGVIRVFDFMTQNRQYFWSQRRINHEAVVFVGDLRCSPP
jgi:hypothetical protein